MRISEETLNNWRMPPSNSEEERLCNAERLIREAITSCEELNSKDIEVFGQGSYANDTNIKFDSDVDINVCLNSTVFYDLPNGMSKEDFGYTDSNYDFFDYKNTIENALIKKFGSTNVEKKNKCLKIKENSNRVSADVVPTFKYNWHLSRTIKHIGTKFISASGDVVINFPKQHIENGKNKNFNTQKRFKRLTRIFKRLKINMKENNIDVSDNITSFLIESLIWNTPHSYFNNHNTWTERLKESIIYLYNTLDNKDICDNWGEVSNLIYLFNSNRKWSKTEVKQFLVQSWDYMEF